MNQHITDYLRVCIAEKIFPGCAVGVYLAGISDIAALGNFTYDPLSPPVLHETVYDVASLTKAIPTACCAHTLLEEKKIRLDTRCVEIIPELTGEYRESILVSHLLTHTLDFDFRLSEKKDLRPPELLRAIFNAPLKSAPGTSFFYANATSILLGMVIERITGKRLDAIAEETFFRPLGMRDTAFFPGSGLKERTAPTEMDPWRNREIRGEVHDESAWALRPGFVAGSAGLFSTVPDLLRFCAMLMNRGTMDGRRYFRPETVALMHTNGLAPGFNVKAAYGWELDNEKYMGANRTASTFGKTGFTGCTIIMKPEKEAALVFLTNHTYPLRCNDREVISRVRRRLAEMTL